MTKNDRAFPETTSARISRSIWGLVIGSGLGFFNFGVLGNWNTTWTRVAVGTIVTAAVCGVLSAVLGDRFWRKLLYWWPW